MVVWQVANGSWWGLPKVDTHAKQLLGKGLAIYQEPYQNLNEESESWMLDQIC